MFVATGWGSTIVQALLPLLPEGEKAKRAVYYDVPLTADRYLFCAGVLRPQPIARQADSDITQTLLVNCASVIQACDRIIEANDAARICVLGSESGFSWSFDGAYAAAKAGLHRYVETKRLRTSEQQLVCVAPGIIADAGMTLRRTDKRELNKREMLHPKGRFLEAAEVARLIRFLLYDEAGYVSGCVVRMNGGERR
jgi:NAD(P)-dependent dehydrogenase (short-subunit alcohol dehydrogenase family)